MNARAWVTLACLLFQVQALASEGGEGGEKGWGSTRTINGHNFPSNSLTESALIMTTFDFRLGARYQRVPDAPVPGFGNADLNSITALGRFDLSIRVLEQLAIFGNAEVGIISGTNARTILLDIGLASAFTGEGGVAVRIFRLPKSGTQLTFRAAVGGGGGSRITIGNLIDSLRDTPLRTSLDILNSGVGNFLVSPVNAFNYRGALALAQPLGKAFSVQASLELRSVRVNTGLYQAITRQRVNSLTVFVEPTLSLAFNADGASVGFPVALLAEYRFAHTRRQNYTTQLVTSGNDNDIAATIYYSGRRDFQVGITLLASFGSPRQSIGPDTIASESDRTRAIAAEFMMAYFW